MKLFAGVAISFALLAGGEQQVRPEPFFVEGNELVYRSMTFPREGESMDVEATLRIKNVITRGSAVTSEGELGYGKEGSFISWQYRVRFSCDSLNFYVHAMNWLYEPIQKEFDINSIYEGDSLAYPLNMKTGDTLPDAHAKRSYSAKGTKDITVMDFTDRKVVSLDTIETNFGTRSAYRIDMKVHASTDYVSGPGGKRENNMEYLIQEWFIPSIGIVRSEYIMSGYGTIKIVMQKYRIDK